MFKSLSRSIRAPFDRRRAVERLEEFHRKTVDAESAVDLALDFGGRGKYRVRTTQIRSEILHLARRVEELAPARILEIGTYWGGTLLIWAQFAREEVVSCDLTDRPQLRELAPAFAPRRDCQVELWTGDSHSEEFRTRVRERFGPGTVDFLFIDGDHLEVGVEQDYLDYGDLVRPGGLIAFHDIALDQPIETNEVGRLWERLRDRAETEEIQEAPDHRGYGIGILRMPEDGVLPRPRARAE